MRQRGGRELGTCSDGGAGGDWGLDLIPVYSFIKTTGTGYPCQPLSTHNGAYLISYSSTAVPVSLRHTS
jgi:hypothetical protein